MRVSLEPKVRGSKTSDAEDRKSISIVTHGKSTERVKILYLQNVNLKRYFVAEMIQDILSRVIMSLSLLFHSETNFKINRCLISN